MSRGRNGLNSLSMKQNSLRNKNQLISAPNPCLFCGCSFCKASIFLVVRCAGQAGCSLCYAFVVQGTPQAMFILQRVFQRSVRCARHFSRCSFCRTLVIRIINVSLDTHSILCMKKKKSSNSIRLGNWIFVTMFSTQC